ncbi:MAG: D-alanyl-D-alanine carboxypeptidase family protein, partial [Pseudomonadota bacterium]
MTVSLRRGVAAAALALCFAIPAAAQDFAFRATAGLLIDAETGMTLAAKDADRPIPPASMSKLMTLFIAFEAIRDGRLSFDDQITVGKNAFRKGGSTTFLKLGQRVSVADIIRGIVVQSGNDAAIALAEAMAGTELAFAEAMTQRAREIGMTNSRFVNATGWPDPNEFMSVRDIAIVARRLIEDFPDLYPLFAETEFEFNGVNQNNRNPLLYGYRGGDGLKTGHTEEAGYGLAGSAVRDGRRLISVVTGLPSRRARREESERLLDWGFRN